MPTCKNGVKKLVSCHFCLSVCWCCCSLPGWYEKHYLMKSKLVEIQAAVHGKAAKHSSYAYPPQYTSTVTLTTPIVRTQCKTVRSSVCLLTPPPVLYCYTLTWTLCGLKFINPPMKDNCSLSKRNQGWVLAQLKCFWAWLVPYVWIQCCCTNPWGWWHYPSYPSI